MNDDVSRETLPEYFPQEVADQEFEQWLALRPEYHSDSTTVFTISDLEAAFTAGMNAGYEVAIDHEREG